MVGRPWPPASFKVLFKRPGQQHLFAQQPARQGPGITRSVMATRRPKVPRANPAARPADPAPDGGDVIRADFGGTRGAGGVNGSKPPSSAPPSSAPPSSSQPGSPKDKAAGSRSVTGNG